MVSRMTVAIVMVLVGAVIVAGFLAMAIYGEVTRPKGTERMSKLILVTALDRRDPAEEAKVLKDVYGDFLSLRPDVEMAYLPDGRQKLVALEAALNLSHPYQEVSPTGNAIALKNEQAMFDELYSSFSPEGTELDKNAETIFKQLSLLSVKSQDINNILKRLGNPSLTPDLLAIEAWPPAEIRILAMKPDENTFEHFRDAASFDMLRHELCPASGPGDYYCKFARE